MDYIEYSNFRAWVDQALLTAAELAEYRAMLEEAAAMAAAEQANYYA